MESIRVSTDDGVALHVGATGAGPDVVILSGGPGCVHYLEDDALAPAGFRAWFPEPRGVGRSQGGAHGLTRAVADLEQVRSELGVERWVVLGHSWGSDLAVRYALDRPAAVAGVVGVAGHGLHDDRGWSEEYHRRAATQPGPEIAFAEDVWVSLRASFKRWIHEPALLRALADSPVPMVILTAGEDVRPSWPLAQLAALVPGATFEVVPDVPHDLWSSHPDVWRTVVTDACRRLTDR